MKGSESTVRDMEFAVSEEIGFGVVKIKVYSHYDQSRLVDEVNNAFDRAFRTGYFRVVFDMGNIVFPNSSFIGMLVGRTMEARRYGGDVKIVNIADTTRNQLATFSPLTYLSFSTDDVLALEEFTTSDSEAIEELAELEDGKASNLQVAATVECMNMITSFVESLAQKAGMEPVEISKLKIAVYEAGMNVIEHGYRFAPDKFMEVEVLVNGNQFRVKLKDQGDSFELYDVKKYDVQSAFNHKRKGGYGLYIIQRSVDEIKYEQDSVQGNTLTLIKRF